MSDLLIFRGDDQRPSRWLQLDDGQIIRRGAATDPLPPLLDPETDDPVCVALVVPGGDVAVHWLEMPPGLAPLQAAAAARLIAVDIAPESIADLHIAVGPEREDGVRAVALVPRILMAEWLAEAQTAGLDPDIVVPEPLLLLPPDEGLIRYGAGDRPLFRGPSDAFSIEPELAALAYPGVAIAAIDDAAFEAGLDNALAALPANLRQPPFAKARRWAIDWPLVRRLAMIAGAILLVTLAIQIATIARYTSEADAAEAEADAIAARALGSDVDAGRGAALLADRLARLQGGGVGYAPIAAAAFAAVQAVPNVELTALTFDRDGSLRISAAGDSPALLQQLVPAIAQRGFVAEASDVRQGGERPQIDLTVRTR